MAGPAYPPTRAVSALVQEHFTRHITSTHLQGRHAPPPLPDTPTIEAIIDAAFWGSLRREEGYFPKISLAFLSREQAGQPLTFERPLPLIPVALSRLAPAVERPGIHLGVWRYGDELCVWGTTRTVPMLCFVLEVIEPGLLVVKYRGGQDPNKFVNVAVLRGDEVKVVDKEGGARMPDFPSFLNSLLGSPADSINVLVQLSLSMRMHGRGGTLLVVPHNTDLWRESILQPVSYSVSPPFSELTELIIQEASERSGRSWREGFRRAIDAIAGLTAVDGATLINSRYELLAFGAKIGRRDGGSQVEQVIMTEPVLGAAASIVNPVQLGGTRHLSAAQFVQDQRDSGALVASQDGRFTVFAWSPSEEIVRAHLVEALLL